MFKRYQGFKTINISNYKTRRLLVSLILGTALAFIFGGLIAMLQMEKRVNLSFIDRFTRQISPKTLSMMMGDSIPYLRENVRSPGMVKMFSRVTFEMATGLNLKDPRTFLGRELPLFSLFDGRIAFASNDIDYTYIPIESPPPLEIEKEILKGMESEGEPVDSKGSGIKNKNVLIYTTHFWESYLPELGRSNGSDSQASDLKKNVTALGKYLAVKVEEEGVGAVSTKRIYSWQNSYGKSRNLVKEVMQRHTNMQYLIDVHRDSKRRNKTTIKIDGKSHAMLTFVVGKASKHYEQNLSFAKTMCKAINKEKQGLCSMVYEKERDGKSHGEYNQSLSPYSILVEVGGVDNTFKEAYLSLDVLAKVVAAHAQSATPVEARQGAKK